MLGFNYTDAFAGKGVARKDLAAYKGRLRETQKYLRSEQQAGRLGFADLPADRKILAEVRSMANIYARGIDTVVVLGIGGSALGFIALKEALLHPFHNQVVRPAFYVLDNIDPELVSGVLDLINPQRTLVNVITKSGSTAETIGQFLIFFELFAKKLGSRKRAVKHFVLTTDPKKGPLRDLARQECFPSLPVAANVGGRYSVLTPVGLFPAALAGINIKALVTGAGQALAAGLTGNPLRSPCLAGAALHYLHYRQGRRMAVMMPYANNLFRTADWFRQLWAESLGKAVDRRGRPVHVGPTPIAALGATDQHSQVQLYAEGPDDKFYTFLRIECMRCDLRYPATRWKDEAFTYFHGHSMFELLQAEAEATRFALVEAGRPCAEILLPRADAESLGRLFMYLELQTAAAGHLFDIDPFDQPGVEAGKRYAFGLLGRQGYEAEARKIKQHTGRPLMLKG